MEGYGNENPGAFQSTRPCGARLPPRQAPSSMPYFNPCAPCGARRRRFGVARAAAGFQPTRPLRGATPAGQLPFMRQPYFNPRAPCGARPFLPTRQCLPKEFQPTRPLRGATAKLLTTLLPLVFQPTRPLRGATPLVDFGLDLVNNFNPRAPCGARPHPARRCPAQATFQPTRPCGARLFCAFPRTRSGQYFNPRALAGRDTSSRTRGQDNEISTHAPLRGATNFILMKGWSFYISTHAPLAGRDIRELCPQEGQNSFQPTRPLRGATFRRIDLCFDVIIFQPTRPCGARRANDDNAGVSVDNFNPRALAGRDTVRY